MLAGKKLYLIEGEPIRVKREQHEEEGCPNKLWINWLFNFVSNAPQDALVGSRRLPLQFN